MSAYPKEKDKDLFWSLFTSSIRVAFRKSGASGIGLSRKLGGMRRAGLLDPDLYA
jgi:hypothetical protein